MRAASRVKATAMVMAAARSSPAAGRRCGRRAKVSSLPGVSRVVPNALKDRLVAEVLGLPLDEFELEPLERAPVPGARARTRAFIKVQDGCDNRCTFCVTALACGKGRSREGSEGRAEIRAVSCHFGQEVTTAVQEAVLTGVHLGSWGQDLQPGQKLGKPGSKDIG